MGTAFLRLNTGDFNDVWMPVPPLPEQRIIAAYLDRETARIDGLVERLERLIALLREKRQAVISHAVTKGLDPSALMKDSGIDWLGEVPAHWEVLTFRHCVDAIEQGWSPEGEDRTKLDDEWGVLKSGCVNRGLFRPSEHKALPADVDPRPSVQVHEGDVLMCRASGSIDLLGSVARARQVPPRMMFSDKTYRFRFSRRVSSADYVVATLASFPSRDQIELLVSGADGLANNISKEAVRSIWVALPPADEQASVAAYVEQTEKEIRGGIAKLQEAIRVGKERRAALISAAVTGQIPLAEVTSHAEAAE